MHSLEVGRALARSERPAWRRGRGGRLRASRRQAGPAPAGLGGCAKGHAIAFRSSERPMRIWKWGGLRRLYLTDVLRSHTGCWEENRLSLLEELAQDLGGSAGRPSGAGSCVHGCWALRNHRRVVAARSDGARAPQPCSRLRALGLGRHSGNREQRMSYFALNPVCTHVNYPASPGRPLPVNDACSRFL